MSWSDFGVWMDEVHCVVDGDAGVGHAGRDQFQLPRKYGDVARGVDTRDVRLHGRRDLDVALLELEPPFGDGAERGQEAELRDHTVHGDGLFFLRLVVDEGDPLDAGAARDRLELPEGPQLHLARGAERLYLRHCRVMGPE